LAPVQAIVLPISEKYNDYAEGVVKKMKGRGLRVEGDYRSEKIGYKIREARNQRVPYMMVVGEKEAESGTVALRSRQGEEGSIAVEDVLKRLADEVEQRTNNGGR